MKAATFAFALLVCTYADRYRLINFGALKGQRATRHESRIPSGRAELYARDIGKSTPIIEAVTAYDRIYFKLALAPAEDYDRIVAAEEGELHQRRRSKSLRSRGAAHD